MPSGRRHILPLFIVLLSLSLTACDTTLGQQPSPQPTPSPSTRPSQQERPASGERGILPSWLPLPAPLASTSTPSPTPAPPPQGLVVVVSEKDQTLTLLDAATEKVQKTVRLDAPARAVTIGPDGRTAWVFGAKRGETDLYFADLDKAERAGSKRLRDAPYAVAFSSDGRRAYVALHGGSGVAFVDAEKRGEIGQVKLGRQTEGVEIRRRPSAVAVVKAEAGEAVFVAGEASGAVWALDAGSGQTLAEIEVGGGPIALLADPGRRRLHVVVQTLNQLVSVDVTTHAVVARLDLPGVPVAAALDPRGAVYVVGREAGEVWIVDPAGGAVSDRIQVGSEPAAIAFSLDGARAYVVNRGDGTLSVLDPATRRVVSTVPIGADPAGVAFAPRPVGSTTPTPPPAKPSPTPTMVPTPTRLPQNAKPPERRPPDAVKEVFVPDAQFPVAMAFAPDGRLFYAELRTGKIRVVENGILLAEPLYDFTVSGQPEAGLLGLTLDPDFARNHYVYVFYTKVAGRGDQDGASNGPNEVARLTEVDGKGTALTPILADLPSGQVHNGGSLRFGPDRKLYVTIGETGQMSNSQDLSTPAGKILRINPDGSIPADNPFANQPGKHGAIWAYGLRNSFDFDFHPESGALVASESGPGDNDELNLVMKGANYGWPPSGYQSKPDLIDPIAAYNPVISPSGVAFYVADQIPEWRDSLFYCNYHQGQLRRARMAAGSFDRIVFEEVVASDCTLDVAQGPDGALYYSDTTAIYRIRGKTSSGLKPVAPSADGRKRTPTPTLPANTRAQDRDVNVSLTEWKIDPSRTVVPAGKVRFLVENLGNTVHSFRIVGGKVDASTEVFGPGESRLLVVDLAPGEYRLDCPVGRHTELGMEATITVVGN